MRCPKKMLNPLNQIKQSENTKCPRMLIKTTWLYQAHFFELCFNIQGHREWCKLHIKMTDQIQVYFRIHITLFIGMTFSCNFNNLSCTCLF